MTRFILAFLTASALTACTAGGLSTSMDGRHAPGFDPSGVGVDAMLVGHRLMDAGEYQLAYESYIRAAATQGMTADVLNAISSASLRLGRLNEAETLLRRAIDMDDTSPEAWNNLGVVLMSKSEFAEARQVFRRAFVLSGGSNELIRENLRLAIANMENPAYDGSETNEYKLVWRGSGDYLITTTE